MKFKLKYLFCLVLIIGVGLMWGKEQFEVRIISIPAASDPVRVEKFENHYRAKAVKRNWRYCRNIAVTVCKSRPASWTSWP